jgi:4,5-dihydroxyphthalate decarboxylase
MPLRLTMAISDYVHTRDLVTARVRAEGIDLNILSYPFEQVGLRFAKGMEFDISEFSLAGYCAHVASGAERKMVGIPVFPSRVFRQSGFFINEASGITTVEDLRGKRIGIPQWSQTATVYARGYLAHDVGIDLAEIDWVQAGVNRPGRTETASLRLPQGVRVIPQPERSLSGMLETGEIDAAISARVPDCVLTGSPGVRPLFKDARAVEVDHFRRTGIFPIMHVIVVRQDVYEANRWIMRNLFDAFEASKQSALRWLLDSTTSYLPAPWGPSYIAEMNGLLFPDGNAWPYGIEANRVTLEAFLLYCYEQGVTARHLTPEELFPPEFGFDVVV